MLNGIECLTWSSLVTPQKRSRPSCRLAPLGLIWGRVFQVHGIDAAGRIVIRRKLQRSEMATFFAELPPCLLGMEACATAHHWARLIGASGHEVPPHSAIVRQAYVRRSKTDAADEAFERRLAQEFRKR